jgi:hypothetical protein
VKLDLLQLNARQLLDLYHACASALERGGQGTRVGRSGNPVQEQLLVPLPEAALVVDPRSSRK